MNERISITSPEVLQLSSGDAVCYGGDQEWYATRRQRMSGCGPTTTSNLIWYLCATRPDVCGGLFDPCDCRRTEMLRLMETMWYYVKPGMHGVNRPSLLADGAVRYAAVRGVSLNARVLDVPEDPSLRPSPARTLAFLCEAFADDLPVAFLNLSNGALQNLDNWHWVTLIAADSTLHAEMYDQSARTIIDVKQWLDTTTKGGAFVVLSPTVDA